MRTTIVCGLLGAGKTTFIQQFIKHVTGRAVVLVNDFGKAGIDGEILSSGGIESIELPSGCVCCTLKFDLMTSLEKIRDTFKPDHLLIEPSGVASPSAVLEALELLKMASVTVVGIVDATEFVELYEAQMYGRFFEDQIVNSDIILVNKTDIAAGPLVEKTESVIGELNPKAIVIRTVNADPGGPLADVTHSAPAIRKQGAHFQFATHTLHLGASVPHTAVRSAFDNLAGGKLGDIVRAKAVVQTDRGPYRFDLVYGKVDEKPMEKAVAESRLVVIGEVIEKEAMMSLF